MEISNSLYESIDFRSTSLENFSFFLKQWSMREVAGEEVAKACLKSSLLRGGSVWAWFRHLTRSMGEFILELNLGRVIALCEGLAAKHRYPCSTAPFLCRDSTLADLNRN